MAPSARAASLLAAAAAAVAPAGVEGGFACEVNTKENVGALCDSHDMGSCDESSCCVSVTSCEDYVCQAGYEAIANAPTSCGGPGGDCGESDCCSVKADTCISMMYSGESCSGAEEFVNTANYGAAATDSATFQSNCCTAATTCQHFFSVFQSSITMDPAKVTDYSKFGATTTAATFGDNCQTAPGTCSASVCAQYAGVELKASPPASCGSVECGVGECCEPDSTICWGGYTALVGAGQSATCAADEAINYVKAYDSALTATFSEQCCEAKVACEDYVAPSATASGAPSTSALCGAAPAAAVAAAALAALAAPA